MNTSPSPSSSARPRPRLLNGWRIAGWGSLAALLALPALAMLLTREVDWTAGDFVFAALLLGFLGGAVEFAVARARSGAALVGFLMAGFGLFATSWVNAAVGIIGDDEQVNMAFFAMVVAALLAAAIARFRPALLRWIAAVLGLGHYAVGLAALRMMPGHAVEWGLLSALALYWLAAAWCFHRAATRSA